MSSIMGTMMYTGGASMLAIIISSSIPAAVVEASRASSWRNLGPAPVGGPLTHNLTQFSAQCNRLGLGNG